MDASAVEVEQLMAVAVREADDDGLVERPSGEDLLHVCGLRLMAAQDKQRAVRGPGQRDGLSRLWAGLDAGTTMASSVSLGSCFRCSVGLTSLRCVPLMVNGSHAASSDRARSCRRVRIHWNRTTPSPLKSGVIPFSDHLYRHEHGERITMARSSSAI